jgi:hypothetical protein
MAGPNIISDDPLFDDSFEVDIPLDENQSADLPSWAEALSGNDGRRKREDSLAEFLRLKTSVGSDGVAKVADRVNALTDFSDKELGADSWAMGLVGMFYDMSNKHPRILNTLTQKTVTQLSSGDLNLAATILKAFIARVRDLGDSAKLILVRGLLSRRFIDRLRYDTSDLAVRLSAIELVKELLKLLGDQRSLDEFLRLVGERSNEPTPRFRNQGLPAGDSEQAAPIGVVAKDKVYQLDVESEKTGSVRADTLTTNMVAMVTEPTINRYIVENDTLSYLMVNMDDIEREVTKIRNVDPKKIAVVTDFNLDDSWTQYKGIFQVTHDPVHQIKVFNDMFESLLEKGFGRILVILADSGLWSSVYFAQSAAEELATYVTVIDSKTFGPPLGYLLRDICNKVQKGAGPQKLEDYVNAVITRSSSYLLVKRIAPIQDKYWFSRLLDAINAPESLSPSLSGVLKFTHPISVLALKDSVVASKDVILTKLRAYNQDTDINVIIHHSNCYVEAMTLREALSGRARVSVTVLQSDDFSSSYFGDHMAVSVIR